MRQFLSKRLVRYEHYMVDRSPHRRVILGVGRVHLSAEVWCNRYALSTSRLCWRMTGHYDRKRGKGYAE
jgi:hypothetical protein